MMNDVLVKLWWWSEAAADAAADEWLMIGVDLKLMTVKKVDGSSARDAGMTM